MRNGASSSRDWEGVAEMGMGRSLTNMNNVSRKNERVDHLYIYI